MSRILILFTFLFLLLIYVLSVRGVVGSVYPEISNQSQINLGGIFESSLERGRYAQIYALANEKTFYIDKYADFVKPDVAWYNGHYLPSFPSGVSVLSMPFYLLGKWLGIEQLLAYSPSFVFALLTCFVIYKISKKLNFSTNASLLSVLTYALMSPALPYSVTLSAHNISAFILCVCIYLSIKTLSEKTYWPIALIVFLFALNFFIDYPNLVIIFPLILYTLFKKITCTSDSKKIEFKIPIKLFAAGLAIIIPIALFVFYNHKIYSRPFALSNTFNIHMLSKQGIEFTQDTLNNSLFEKVEYSNKFSFKQSINGIHVLLFSQDRGLFYYYPVFIFSVLGFIFYAIKKHTLWLPFILVFLFNVLFYASYDDPWGGWSYGPRYLIISTPVLCLSVSYFASQFKSIFSRIVLSIACFYSLFVSLLGALTGNSLPTSVEEHTVNISSTFTTNILALKNGFTSSFFYTQFLINYFKPIDYFVYLFLACLFLILLVIWVSFNERKLQ